MSVVEAITSELLQARCHHCGQLAFSTPDDGQTEFDEVSPEERAWWEVLTQAEEARLLAPTPPQPSVTEAQKTVARCKQNLEQAQARHSRNQQELDDLSIIAKKEKKDAARSHLNASSWSVSHAQDALAEATNILQASQAQQARCDAYDTANTNLYERAAVIRRDLGQRIDQLARRAHQATPGWLANLPAGRDTEDIEEKISRTCAAIAYRRMWGITDPISPLGPEPASPSHIQKMMRELVSGGWSPVRLTYLDFTNALSAPEP